MPQRTLTVDLKKYDNTPLGFEAKLTLDASSPPVLPTGFKEEVEAILDRHSESFLKIKKKDRIKTAFNSARNRDGRFFEPQLTIRFKITDNIVSELQDVCEKHGTTLDQLNLRGRTDKKEGAFSIATLEADGKFSKMGFGAYNLPPKI